MRERWCQGSRKWKLRGSDWIIKKKAQGEKYVFPILLFAANPSEGRLRHFFCTGGKENASWGRNASRQYTKNLPWPF